jgi:hypothetical protein
LRGGRARGCRGKILGTVMGGIQVLAGLASSSQTIGILFRIPASRLSQLAKRAEGLLAKLY